MWIETNDNSWINSDHVKTFCVDEKYVKAYFDEDYYETIDICKNRNEAISELTEIMSKIMQNSKAITYPRLRAMIGKETK